MAAGCAGSDTAQREEEPVCWASAQLQGGSGKAFVETPCPVYKKEGTLCALITWSSDHYDYMIVNEKKLLQVNTEGNAQFMVPLGSLEEIAGEAAGAESGGAEMLPDALGGTSLEIDVQADTTAMSTPHLIDYTLSFVFYKTQEEAEGAGTGVDEAGEAEKASQTLSGEKAPDIDGLTFLSKDENVYAECFAIYRYEGGYAVLSVDDGRRYLIVPEGGAIPEGTDGQGGGAVLKDEDGQELIVLQQPLDRIYLAASSAMALFDAMDGLDAIRFSGTAVDSWYVENAVTAMNSGAILFAGKYSEPDYEKLLGEGCDLAVESTMILHAPEVQEKLEQLGIPVFIDCSSYESHPLGRTEWIKAYGLLLGKEEEAAAAFDAQKKMYIEAESLPTAGKSVACFYINSQGLVVCPRPDSSMAKMIAAAGGVYLYPEVQTDGSRLSTMKVDMESYMAAAGEADVIIYDGAIDTVSSLADIVGKNAQLKDFKAVQENNVYISGSDAYQNSDDTGTTVHDLYLTINGQEGAEHIRKAE